MNIPVKWSDEYYVSQKRVVLTQEQLAIPGLRVLGHHVMSTATEPLVLHFHENAFEFMVIAEGTFFLQASGKKYKVSGGDIFVTPPGEIHSSNEMPLSRGEFYWLQMDISNIQNLLFLNEEAGEDLVERLKAIEGHVIHSDDTDLKKLIKKAFILVETGENKYRAAACLVVFLNMVIEHSKRSGVNLTGDIALAMDYILDNLTQELLLEELADYCGLSISQFKQKFKDQLGVSPRCFINQQKVESAKSLLLEGMSKTEIAMQLGFSSSSYFAAVFKKFTSCTPSEYKNRTRNE